MLILCGLIDLLVIEGFYGQLVIIRGLLFPVVIFLYGLQVRDSLEWREKFNFWRIHVSLMNLIKTSTINFVYILAHLYDLLFGGFHLKLVSLSWFLNELAFEIAVHRSSQRRYLYC